MKKLWLLLLAGGAMTLTPACNNDDEDNGPTGPVTCTVPSTAEIGGVLTIPGEGFAATAEITLRDTAGSETALEDPEITSSGYTGTIPASLSEGSYTVVLYQDGTWELGTVNLTRAADKELPVLNVVVPTAIRLNEALEIAGLGFSSDMVIVLENTTDQTRTELATTLSSNGVSCTLPDGLAAGTYDVILTQGIYEWTIGESLPAAIYKRLVKLTRSITMKFEGVTQESIAEAIAALYGIPVTEEVLQMAAGYLPMFSDSESSEEYDFTYDAEGLPQSCSLNKTVWYSFTTNGDQISGTNMQVEEGYNDIKTFTWTLNNGQVDQSAVSYENRDVDYIWVYDTQGLWCGTNYAGTDNAYLTLVYDEGKFLGNDLNTLFTYSAAPQQNAIFGVDIAKLIFALQGAIIENDQFQAICTNLAGQPSTALPETVLEMDDSTPTITYTFDNDGYVTRAGWLVTGKDPLLFTFDTNSETSYTLVYE